MAFINKTWKPGDVRLTAANLNKYLRDNLQYLYENLGGIPPTIEPWIAVSGGIGFQGSWANDGTPETDAAYAKDAWGVVHMRGSVSGGGSGTVIMFLPSGYRPSSRARPSVAAENVDSAHLRIETNGEVRAIVLGGGWTTGDYICLDCQFSTH